MEMVHGAAGSAALGAERHLWAPAAVGRDFDLTPSSLSGLAHLREHLTIVSNMNVPTAESYTIREYGGDHFRSSAVFLTQAHPKLTDGADVEAGISLDQLYASRVGSATPIPSMQLCIEDVDQGGACGFPYACAYTDSISWAGPTKPLPMIRNPRTVFDELFGVWGNGQSPEARRTDQTDARSILDWFGTAIGRVQRDLGPADRRRLTDYLDNIREIERRLQAVEAFNQSGERRALPSAPTGVPDSFTAHVRLMFDLQLVALASDATRVVSFKLGRDNSNRTYPESGFNGAFHPTSHHSGSLDKILDFARLNHFTSRSWPTCSTGCGIRLTKTVLCSTTAWCSTVHRWAIRICTTTRTCRSFSPVTRAARLQAAATSRRQPILRSPMSCSTCSIGLA